LAVWNVINNTGLGTYGNIVSNVNMADNTNLAADYTMMPQSSRAGNTYLSYEQTVCADYCAVAYFNHIV
jgi:hypothetical protein